MDSPKISSKELLVRYVPLSTLLLEGRTSWRTMLPFFEPMFCVHKRQSLGLCKFGLRKRRDCFRKVCVTSRSCVRCILQRIFSQTLLICQTVTVPSTRLRQEQRKANALYFRWASIRNGFFLRSTM
jgi:hypothetical protein